jgi:hypothetical protein
MESRGLRNIDKCQFQGSMSAWTTRTVWRATPMAFLGIVIEAMQRAEQRKPTRQRNFRGSISHTRRKRISRREQAQRGEVS